MVELTVLCWSHLRTGNMLLWQFFRASCTNLHSSDTFHLSHTMHNCIALLHCHTTLQGPQNIPPLLVYSSLRGSDWVQCLISRLMVLRRQRARLIYLGMMTKMVCLMVQIYPHHRHSKPRLQFYQSLDSNHHIDHNDPDCQKHYHPPQ